MAGAAPHLTVSGSRFYCHWFWLVSMFVFDVVPVIPYGPCAKPGCSILSSPVQVWASFPGASCPLPEPGASSWAGCLHPPAHGHQGCCLAKPGPLIGACCGLRVGATVLGLTVSLCLLPLHLA